MKDETKVIVGKLDYFNPSTGVLTNSVTADHYVKTVNTTPNDGRNLGDGVTPNAWQYTVLQRTGWNGKLSYWYRGSNWSNRVGTYSSPWNGSPISKPSSTMLQLYNEALAKLNDRVRDTVDWAEDIAQASRTAKIGNLANNAADLARQLKRTPIAGIAAGYLQFRYGWKPLLGNIYDTAVLQLQSAQAGRELVVGARTEYPSGDRIVDPDSGTLEPVSTNVRGVRGVRFHVKLRPQPAQSIFDYTTLNPLYLGWNLIPYSFVVDWFWNIGGYLEAMEQALRYSIFFESGFYTELDAYSAVLRTENKWSGAPNNSMYYESVRRYQKEVSFKREILYNWPLPQFPRPVVDLGSGKLLAAAALLGTLLGSPKPKPHLSSAFKNANRRSFK